MHSFIVSQCKLCFSIHAWPVMFILFRDLQILIINQWTIQFALLEWFDIFVRTSILNRRQRTSFLATCKKKKKKEKQIQNLNIWFWRYLMAHYFKEVFFSMAKHLIKKWISNSNERRGFHLRRSPITLQLQCCYWRGLVSAIPITRLGPTRRWLGYYLFFLPIDSSSC